MKHAWTGGQYSLFRALFGAYLAVHFTMLIPYAREVWSNEGVLPDAHASTLIAYFPSLFRFSDAPIVVCITLAVAAINAWNRLSIAFRAVPETAEISERAPV